MEAGTRMVSVDEVRGVKAQDTFILRAKEYKWYEARREGGVRDDCMVSGLLLIGDVNM